MMAQTDQMQTDRRSPTPEEPSYRPSAWFFDGKTGWPNLSVQKAQKSEGRFAITKIEQKPRFKSRHNTLSYNESEAEVTR